MTKSRKFCVKADWQKIYLARDVDDTFVYRYTEKPKADKDGCYSANEKAVYVPKAWLECLCPVELKEGECAEIEVSVKLSITDLQGKFVNMCERIN